MSAASYRFRHRPFFEAASAQELSALGDAERERVTQFADAGGLAFDPGIDPEQIGRAAAYIRRDLLTPEGVAATRRGHNAWPSCDAVAAIATAAPVRGLLRLLYGREPIPFQTLNFPVGSEQRTHSDTIQFNSLPSRFVCGVWVALEDVDQDNGPLHYYPGSHKLPEVQMYDCFDGSQERGEWPSMEDYRRCYEDYIAQVLEREGFERRELHLRRGQAFVWAGSLCHGGCPIIDPRRTRLSQVTHYFFEDCLYYSPRQSHPGVGRLWLRQVYDIAARHVVAHHFNGRSFRIEQPGPFYFDGRGRARPLAGPSLRRRLARRLRRAAARP